MDRSLVAYSQRSLDQLVLHTHSVLHYYLLDFVSALPHCQHIPFFILIIVCHLPSAQSSPVLTLLSCQMSIFQDALAEVESLVRPVAPETEICALPAQEPLLPPSHAFAIPDKDAWSKRALDFEGYVTSAARDYHDLCMSIVQTLQHERARAEQAEQRLIDLEAAAAEHQKADAAADAAKRRLLAQAAQHEQALKDEFLKFVARDAIEDSIREKLLAKKQDELAHERELSACLEAESDALAGAVFMLRKQVRGLREEVHEYEYALAKHDVAIERAEVRAEKAELAVKGAEERRVLELGEMKAKWDADRAEFEAWKRQDEENDKAREKAIKDLQATIKKEEAEHERLMKEIAQDAKDDKGRDLVIATLRTESGKKQKTIGELNKQIAGLQASSRKFEASLKQQESKYQKEVGRRTVAETALNAARGDLAKTNVKLADKERELKRAEEANGKTKDALQQLTTKHAGLNDELDELKKKHNSLHGTVKHFTGALAELEWFK